MYLMKALTILVEDWQEKLEAGKTRISVEEAAQTIGGENYQGITYAQTPRQMADLIYDDLVEVGSLDNAMEAVAQYQTQEELLKERDLLGMMQDFGI